MAFGLPHISFIGHPYAIPCAGHADLGFREATPADAPAILAHLRGLAPADRRMRFCGGVADEALERHVAAIWARDALVIAAHDGPLLPGPLQAAGRVRALVELAIEGREAEIGLTVDGALRRRGVGSYLVETAARLLAPRGVSRIRANILPENTSFLALAGGYGAAVDAGRDWVEIRFEVDALHQAYLRRHAAEVFLAAG